MIPPIVPQQRQRLHIRINVYTKRLSENDKFVEKTTIECCLAYLENQHDTLFAELLPGKVTGLK
jgi:hypothetical protein